MSQNTPITVAYGDGIGPEIMTATLDILQAAGARLELDVIEIGEKMYLQGQTTGIEPRAWDSLRRTRVFLKAPITTPQGGGFKSLNVTTRKMLGPLRQRAPLRGVCAVRGDEAPGHGRGRRPRERGRPVRGDRVSAEREVVAGDQDHQPPGQREDRSVCV